MRLLLLRHGEAAFNATSDEQRSLTDNGRLRLQQMLAEHQQLLEGVERIVHSPYLRTCQTAELVSKVYPAVTCSLILLTPDSSPKDVVEWLSEQSNKTLMLVTHQPLIGNLISLLCEGDLSSPEPMLPGNLAVMELEFPAVGLGLLQAIVR